MPDPSPAASCARRLPASGRPGGLPVYGRHMGGGMHLTFSVDYDTCTVIIKIVWDHKEAYGSD